jgi:hypothetical protein
VRLLLYRAAYAYILLRILCGVLISLSREPAVLFIVIAAHVYASEAVFCECHFTLFVSLFPENSLHQYYI